MVVMTAKVDMKKTLAILGAIAAAIIAVIVLLSGPDTQQTAAPISDNNARIKFLTDLGWEVAATPTESGQVRIPSEATEVFDRYNQLQKQQGYDLANYAGKNAMRYVYKVTNFPGATDPVYATILVYKNEIIGGDITDTSPSGRVQSLKKPKVSTDATAPTATVPAA